MNILLHICCAPCSIYPIEALRKEGHRIGGYFYNPNIHPYSEYLKRKEEVEKYSKEVGLNVTYADYIIEDYFQYISCNETQEDRCPVCWWIRLKEAVKFAKENGFEAFTTTLLGSPYQDHEVLKNICAEIAEKADIKFHYADFRTGFNAARDNARSKGIYLQKYCGCLMSEKDRIDNKGQGSRGQGPENK
jgi:predicted adenine nucleotide alpha hydrolase (AANH) superfamily ATPase